MSFEKWLVQQKKRNDPIGDLAKDFITSESESIRESFRKFHPSQGALDAYDNGFSEYLIETANNLLDEVQDYCEHALSENIANIVEDLAAINVKANEIAVNIEKIYIEQVAREQ